MGATMGLARSVVGALFLSLVLSLRPSLSFSLYLSFFLFLSWYCTTYNRRDPTALVSFAIQYEIHRNKYEFAKSLSTVQTRTLHNKTRCNLLAGEYNMFCCAVSVYVLYRHWDLVQCSSFEITVCVKKRSNDVIFCGIRKCTRPKRVAL